MYWMVPWLFAAEAAIYFFGLIWLPFGAAIANNLPAGFLCNNLNSNDCVALIFNLGFVPFVPGDLLKMLFVFVTVPTLWYLRLAFARWWYKQELVAATADAPLSTTDSELTSLTASTSAGATAVVTPSPPASQAEESAAAKVKPNVSADPHLDPTSDASATAAAAVPEWIATKNL
jgi:hypothetical protein